MNELKPIEYMNEKIPSLEKLEEDVSYLQSSIDKSLNNYAFLLIAENYYAEHLALDAYIYFIENESTGLVKIGCTSNFERRKCQIAGSSLQSGVMTTYTTLKTIRVAKDFMHEAEYEAHMDFQDRRMFGEWFRIDSDDIEDFCKAIKLNHQCEEDDVYSSRAFVTKDYVKKTINSLRDSTFSDIFLRDAPPLVRLNNRAKHIIKCSQEIHKIYEWAEEMKLQIWTIDASGSHCVVNYNPEKKTIPQYNEEGNRIIRK